MAIQDSVAALEPNRGAATPIRRDAVGAEIPVTVHASRTTQGLGKNLPAVHEDTKTVIILQQGAVVRLTASLSTGETVVLTNRMTGVDVLCRVGNVKSQSGIQHYVDLEFIQRAPGFWGDTLAASSAPIASQTPSNVPPPPTAAPRSAAPVAVVPAPSAPVPAPPRASVAVAPSVPTVTVPSAPVAVVPPPAPAPIAPPQAVLVSSPPPAPIVDLPSAAATEYFQAAPLAEPITASWKAPQASSVTPASSGINQSTFGSIGAESSDRRPSTSHKALLAVAAAMLLVLGGAAGGYWVYSRQVSQASSPALPLTASVPVVHATPELTNVSTPAPEPEPAAVSAEPTAPPLDIVVESRPANDAPETRIQPPPVSRAHAPAVRHNVPIEQLKTPKARTAAVRMDSSEAPPAMMGTLNLSDAGTANPLLAAAAAGPAPPPVSSGSTVGGQLQPPQILNSTPPVYPQMARMQKVQGVVTLDALVDETGKVAEATVIAGPEPLVRAAQESVRNWRYKPAQLNGKPIAVHTRISVRFALQ